MDREEIKEKFYSLVFPSHPNDWEVEEVAEHLAGLPADDCSALLDNIPAIWPVSHSLCYRYIQCGSKSIEEVTKQLLPEWVRRILFHYEKGGLRDAEAFMADVHTHFLLRLQSESEVTLESIHASMLHYLRGISGYPLQLAEDAHVWTDTRTIYLPPLLDRFPTMDQNRLLYKFLITYQWELIRFGIFKPVTKPGQPDVTPDTKTHQNPWENMAGQAGGTGLLPVYLFRQGCLSIREIYPGLWRRSYPLLAAIISSTANTGEQEESSFYQLVRDVLPEQESTTKPGTRNTPVMADPLECASFITAHKGIRQDLAGSGLELLLGNLNFPGAEAVIREVRKKEKKTFTTMLARILPKSLAEKTDERAAGSEEGNRKTENAIAVIKKDLEGLVRETPPKKILRIENTQTVVPDDLLNLSARLMTDLGDIPTGYVTAAAGLAGQGITGDGGQSTDADEVTADGQGKYVYDEWDCRRNGYRQNWCTVIEEELPVTKSNFIPRTLEKHSGLRKRLGAQFEMMATAHRFVRRQRDGDDLDLDAITDAMGDMRAGTTVSDRLFTRLIRDERSITTLFLIDMSNSTSGWVGTMIKESLVLLCEAMERVGDRFGVYGFSGMRRSRCKLYHIKDIDEPYNGATRDRISAIGPKDYTRMAPAIRHLTAALASADTKTRLLITLSDGKPEDYDGYNGEYAIEDTRKALLEAQGKDVRPFCITIDKKAHNYLKHMFGTGNYTFINRIESLPLRIPQIYRALTR